MADQPVPVKLRVQRGKGKIIPIEEIQSVLDQITTELKDANSETSRKTAALGLTVTDLKASENPAFATAVFLIGLAIAFANGAAGEGGKLFFDKVIKPRLRSLGADGVGDAAPEPDAKKKDGGTGEH